MYVITLGNDKKLSLWQSDILEWTLLFDAIKTKVTSYPTR